MRKICFTLLCSCFVLTAEAQFSYTTFFDTYETKPCPFDATKTISQPKNWVVYQTQNGAWDGPVDSSRCIAATVSGSTGMKIDLTQIDPSRPLFVRAKAQEFFFTPSLTPNSLFNFNFYGTVSDTSVHIKTGANCVESVCSGVFLGINIPGEVRKQSGLMTQYGNYLEIGTCFPSEFFIEQTLRDLVLKFQFEANAVLTNRSLQLSYIQISQTNGETGYVTEAIAAPFNYNASTSTYEMNIAETVPFSFSQAFLMLYTQIGFPSASNPSYVEARPEPNSKVQETINLTVESFQSLEIQPFTYLRGALVEGNDTLRHIANLVNNGGEICFNFIDVVFNGGSGYKHSGGTLTMQSPFSCMQYRNGSALCVTKGAALHYGNEGTGMLALCANSTIVLEADATLVFDGVLNMSECNDLIPSQQLYMDLPPGARLIFTKDAHLTNQFSKDRQMKLNVRMLGGTLDDSALNPEDRALIQRIYPEPEANLANNLRVSPNPFEGVLNLEWNAAVAETLQVDWLDVQGKLWWTEKRSVEKGLNTWSVAPNVPAGVYFLRFSGGSGWFVKKVVRF
jgi:hypothetical protein